MFKKTQTERRNHDGFTLVELLVVVGIVAALAAIVFTVAVRMKKSADGARQTMAMKESGSLLMLYASDNNNKLPAPVGKTIRPDGSTETVHWHQHLLSLANEGVSMDVIKSQSWWNNGDPFIANRLFKNPSSGRTLKPWCPGFGMNTAPVTILNLPVAYSEGEWQGNARLPLARITDPARLPIITPRDDYHYSTVKAGDPGLVQFLVGGKLPVLFVDGHIENIAPKEYEARKLHLQPK